jgi:hypothetical protein
MFMDPKLRRRIVWNETRVEELYAQVEPLDGPLKLDTLGVKLRTGLIDGQGTFKGGHRGPPSWAVMYDAIVERLRESGQLLAVRPVDVTDYQRGDFDYVCEWVTATRVLLPVTPRRRGDPHELSVWVADPPARPTDPKDEWDFFGSYLFLVEEGDPGRHLRGRYYLSGVSALARCVRMAQPVTDVDALRRLGRDSTEHPIEKLERLGGVVSLEREIEALYHIRYMTDEQGGWFVSEGRVHDLLAYPVAILA